MSETQLAKQQKQISVQEPSLMQMMARLAEDPDQNKVAALKELVQLKMATDDHQIKMEEIAAARQFSADLVAMKGEMPTISATQEVRDDHGAVRFRFAGRAEILRQARPTMTKWGFAETYDSREEDGKTIGICILNHRGGHKQASQFACAASAPPKTGASQGSMSTLEYALRGALCAALGVVTDKLVDGTDARGLGEKITPEQAADLERRVKAAGVDVGKFLEFADADSFENIYEAAYPRLDANLKRREANPRQGQRKSTEDLEKMPDHLF